MTVLVGLSERAMGRQEKKREWHTVNSVETQNICVGI
jgi:hypothetical protein